MQHLSISGNKAIKDHIEGTIYKRNKAMLKLKQQAPDRNVVDLLTK
jgi:hypothetical protein